MSGSTETAVPPILAGQVREAEVPATDQNYPENIFQRLGPSYDVLDLQSATDLNPARTTAPKPDATKDERRWKIASDTAIIYANVRDAITARGRASGHQHPA
jgi:hypothetical protein